MAAIKAMIAETMYPVTLISHPLEPGGEQICGHEHSGEAQQNQQVECHEPDHGAARINVASTSRICAALSCYGLE